MKDTLTDIHERASVRAYTPQAVAPEQTEALLRAAMAAPSSKNKQPWHFIVVSEPATRQALAATLPYAAMLSGAPLAVVVCGDTEVHTGEAAISWVMDCAAATENLLLAAQALGLGAVWTGVYPYPERVAGVGRALDIPAHIVPLNIVAVGYPEKPGRPKNKWNPAKVHYEKFGIHR